MAPRAAVWLYIFSRSMPFLVSAGHHVEVIKLGISTCNPHAGSLTSADWSELRSQ